MLLDIFQTLVENKIFFIMKNIYSVPVNEAVSIKCVKKTS